MRVHVAGLLDNWSNIGKVQLAFLYINHDYFLLFQIINYSSLWAEVCFSFCCCCRWFDCTGWAANQQPWVWETDALTTRPKAQGRSSIWLARFSRCRETAHSVMCCGRHQFFGGVLFSIHRAMAAHTDPTSRGPWGNISWFLQQQKKVYWIQIAYRLFKGSALNTGLSSSVRSGVFTLKCSIFWWTEVLITVILPV